MGRRTPTHGRGWALRPTHIHSTTITRHPSRSVMRWSVVRLIARREVRDQLRDRRTMFLILGLPVLMYPLFVVVALAFMAAVKEKRLVVGVVGAAHLPKPGAAAPDPKDFPPLLVDGRFPEHYLQDRSKGGP